jgi:hypothetical protein
MKSPARLAITVSPLKIPARLVRRAPRAHLLAISGQHEQRVVDRDADPDHRRHVGHEDRHLGRAAEEVDERARDDHRTGAQRERQDRGGERPEHGEQHERDDREPPPLRDLDVLLRRLLQRRPQRALPDEVQRDVLVRLAGGDRLAEVPRDVGRVPIRNRSLERDHDRPRRGGGARRLAAGGAGRRRIAVCGGGAGAFGTARRAHLRGGAALGILGERDARHLLGRSVEALERGAKVRAGRSPLGPEDRGERRPRLLGELDLQPVLDGLRLRAGDAEPAAGQMVGLLRRERDRGEEREDPRAEHHRAMAAQERVESEHERLHEGPRASLPNPLWLAGQETARRGRVSV